MEQRYSESSRPAVRRHVQGTGLRVLDVGCNDGALLDALREDGQTVLTAGVEIDPTAGRHAAEKGHEVHILDVERAVLPFEPGTFDYVICADVLEHLVDPWTTLPRLVSLLRSDGRLIVSAPNVRHWTVVLPLLLKGRWRYTETGLLDRTHLRFFTRQTTLELIRGAGLKLLRVGALVYGPRGRQLWRLGLRDLAAFQYIVVAEREAIDR